MAKKNKAPKSSLPVISRGDAAFRGLREGTYTPAPEVGPARTKKPPSKLRMAVREGVLTKGEAVETALLNRFYKKQGVKPKPFSPKTASAPPRSTGFSNKLKPDIPASPKEQSFRSMTKSKNATTFSGIKEGSYTEFIKNLEANYKANQKSTIKAATGSGAKRDLTFRYTNKEIAQKVRTGKISESRAQAWRIASTNRLGDRAEVLAKETAKEERLARGEQRERGVVRRDKAEQRKKLYQSTESKRFKEEKVRSKNHGTIYAAEKSGKISLDGIQGQKFVRVSKEQYELGRKAEEIANKNKAVAKGKTDFADALKNVESGAKVETRRKVTVAELESAFENAQKEATLLEKKDMPKGKVKDAKVKAKLKTSAEKPAAKKGGRAKLVAPAGKMELNAENLKKVLESDNKAVNEKSSKKGKAGKVKAKVAEATAPAKEKPASKTTAPKAKVATVAPAVDSKPKATSKEAPKAKAKVVASTTETPKAKAKPVAKAAPVATETKAPAPKAKSAPKVSKPKPEPAPPKERPSLSTLQERADSREAGVRQRAGANALERAKGRMAERAGKPKIGAGGLRGNLVKAALGVGASILTGAGIGYMSGSGKDSAPSAPAPKPKPKPAVATKAQGPSTRGGARGAKPAAPAKAAKQAARPATKASTPPKGKVVASKPASPMAAPMTANPEKAIADFEAKLRGAGVISIAGGANGKAQMVPQPMSASQLEDKFKKKGAR